MGSDHGLMAPSAWDPAGDIELHHMELRWQLKAHGQSTDRAHCLRWRCMRLVGTPLTVVAAWHMPGMDCVMCVLLLPRLASLPAVTLADVYMREAATPARIVEIAEELSRNNDDMAELVVDGRFVDIKHAGVHMEHIMPARVAGLHAEDGSICGCYLAGG